MHPDFIAYKRRCREHYLASLQPPIYGDPYLLIGGPMAGETVFLANPSTLPIRWRGQTGQYVGAHGSTSLRWMATP